MYPPPAREREQVFKSKYHDQTKPNYRKQKTNYRQQERNRFVSWESNFFFQTQRCMIKIFLIIKNPFLVKSYVTTDNGLIGFLLYLQKTGCQFTLRRRRTVFSLSTVFFFFLISFFPLSCCCTLTNFHPS